MEQGQFITNPSHQKGNHLNFEERVVIQTRLRDGWSFRKIALICRRIYNTAEDFFGY